MTIKRFDMAAVTAAAVSGLALAGCSPSPNAPASPSPGLWELTQSTTPLGEAPGEQPRSATTKACLKAADLDFTQLARRANGSCTTSDTSDQPGKVHAKVACNADQPDASEAVIDGTTTKDALHIEVASVENLLPPGATAPVVTRLKIVIDGKRKGDCPGL